MKRYQHDDWRLGTSIEIQGEVFVVTGMARRSGTLGARSRYEIEFVEPALNGSSAAESAVSDPERDAVKGK
jgi:hypothetical protein